VSDPCVKKQKGAPFIWLVKSIDGTIGANKQYDVVRVVFPLFVYRGPGLVQDLHDVETMDI
jgi:hypothetical protein